MFSEGSKESISEYKKYMQLEEETDYDNIKVLVDEAYQMQQLGT